ncbi:FdtA/QdtA family cupin domain-containing protein [Aureispira sp. CCB-E]|uniref:sugar 3,4-ketoisomerase n=1 Tax=Aureispira sp. CCB-E TaxID=3051121 RepID=UPI002868C80F|nr:FdtA/QdtA family cupin domain-containing protein [Aureispira sp. CCB-E]WMX15211.1 FdtA/QdtA family cupin domain-containing protein [Aureispira sp. CCB-E]
MKKPYQIQFEQIGAPHLGYISVAEIQDNIPFEIKRVYWTYFTPNHVERGNHSHRALEQVIICVAGTIYFEFESVGGETFEFELDEPSQGIYVPSGYWRRMKFSHNAVLVCMASQLYDEADYIRDYNEFKKYI